MATAVNESHVQSLQQPGDAPTRSLSHHSPGGRSSASTRSIGRHSHRGKDSPMKGSQRIKGSGSGREMLMGMIAQETVTAWEKDDAEEIFENNVNTAQKTAEETYYAQMNGEALDPSVDAGPIISGASSAAGNNVEDVADDDSVCSFSGLDLHDTEDNTYTSSYSGTSVRLNGNKSVRSKRSSKGSSTIKNSVGDSDADSEAKTLADLSAAPSIDEIQQFVMEHIPQALQDSIPRESWGQIFGEAIKAHNESKKKKSPSDLVLLDKLPAGDPNDKVHSDDDVVSVLSDMTEVTTSFLKSSPDKIASSGPEDDKSVAPTEAESVHSSGRSLRRRPSNDGCSRASDTRSRASHNTHLSRRSLVHGSKPGDVVPAKVSFHVVQVRYYERILALNPSVSSGPPVGIGWRFNKGGQMTVDEWELQRGETRSAVACILPRHVREKMLKEWLFTPKDIADGVRSVMKAKNQRRTTISNLNAAGVEEAAEKVSRRVKGLLSFGRNKDLVVKQ
jgi:hypothetical protein